jgi:hypothetical protein
MAELRETIGDFFISLRTLERVPLFLRFITKVSLACAIFFPLFTILPLAGGEITVDGESLTWQEFWKRGDALIFLIGGPLLLAVPYGVLGKKKWVRPYLIGLPVVQNLTAGIIAQIFNYPATLYLIQNTQESVRYVLFLIIWGYFAIWYLYYKDTVVDFFSVDESPPESEIIKN